MFKGGKGGKEGKAGSKTFLPNSLELKFNMLLTICVDVSIYLSTVHEAAQS